MSGTDRRGTTLLELLVAVVILAGVLVMTFGMMYTGQETFNYGVTLAAAETRGRVAVDEVAMMLVDSSMSQISPDLAVVSFTPALRFRRCTGYAGGAMQWGAWQQIGWQTDASDAPDGVDNDGDGLIDEGQLVWIRDLTDPVKTTTVLAGNVARFLEGELPNGIDDNGNGLTDERGFALRRQNNEIVIYLTIQGRDGKFGLVERTLQTSVRLRN